MENNRYEYWQELLGKPGMLVDPEYQGAKDGFWRMIGARTKADYPVAIWQTESGVDWIKVGRKAEFPMATSDGDDFLTGSWMKCEACTEEAYRAAIDSGFWADGKPSRIQSDATKLGVDLGEGATGGNAPPPYELYSQQLDELTAKAKALVVKDQATADEAKVLVDRIQLVWTKADAERDKEKRPHDEASKTVQAKWQNHMTPASTARQALNKALQDWLNAEQKKADAAALAETARRREEAQKEFQADIANLSHDAFEAKWNQSKPADEVEAAMAVAPVTVAPVQAEKVTAGGAFTRNTSAKKNRSAKIVDMDKLYGALKDSEDFVAFMQKKADAAMRAKIKLPGVEVVEE